MMFKSLLVGLFLNAGAALYAQSPGTGALQLKQEDAYGTPVIRVSFDGEGGPFGVFRIKDSTGTVVRSVEEAELIPSPNSFAIAVGDLKGTYEFSVETGGKTYTTRFTVL